METGHGPSPSGRKRSPSILNSPDAVVKTPSPDILGVLESLQDVRYVSVIKNKLWRIVLREPEVTKSSLTTALVAGFVFHGLLLLNLLVDKSGWVAG